MPNNQPISLLDNCKQEIDKYANNRINNVGLNITLPIHLNIESIYNQLTSSEKDSIKLYLTCRISQFKGTSFKPEVISNNVLKVLAGIVIGGVSSMYLYIYLVKAYFELSNPHKLAGAGLSWIAGAIGGYKLSLFFKEPVPKEAKHYLELCRYLKIEPDYSSLPLEPNQIEQANRVRHSHSA